MKLDFSPPSEAPEEFRALTFTAPPMVKGQGRPALLASQIYHQGTPPLHAVYVANHRFHTLYLQAVRASGTCNYMYMYMFIHISALYRLGHEQDVACAAIN